VSASIQPTQLPLSVHLRADARFENFTLGQNALVVEQLQRFSRSELSEQHIFLAGPNGAGLTYLLQASCHEAERAGLAALYLPAEELETLDPAIFEALESYDLVCIDDLQLLLGKPEWEQALFHLYNRLRDTGRRLLISANNTPAHLAVGLADLASRLTWGLVFQLQPLNDADKLAALDAQARARGLVIAEDVLQFLLNHSDRNLRILMRQLDQLDSASLEQKRRVTIPFVKQVLGWS